MAHSSTGLGGMNAEMRIIKAELDNDTTDIGALWNEALRAYKATLGKDLVKSFRNVEEMVADGEEQMNKFISWRHKETKVAKLRGLLMQNLGYIEAGTQQLVIAASASFPPAVAIGTAMTLIFQACKDESADYDVVVAFFEDMNNFLDRVSIIQSKVPKKWAYRNSLMNVFTSLLRMCAFAEKYIRLRRFKKWIINVFQGQDAELAASRKSMDTALNRFHSATQLTILANSEDMLRMQAELQNNLESQNRLATEQQMMLERVILGQEDLQGGMDEVKQSVALLTSLMRERREDARQAKESQAQAVPHSSTQKKLTSNRLRSVVPDMPDLEREAQLLSDSTIEGTCNWIFDTQAWQNWSRPVEESSGSPLLLLIGETGTGKSHIAASVYKNLCQRYQQDIHSNVCVTYFSFRDGIENRNLFLHALTCALLQINDQSATLRDQLEAELKKDEHDTPQICAHYWRDLIIKLFEEDSKYTLYMVLDGLDELRGANKQGDGRELTGLTRRVRMIKNQALRIRFFATARDEIKTRYKPDPGSELYLSTDDIAPDLRMLIHHRLQSTDTAYRGVTQTSKYVRQRVEDAVLTHAKSFLYAEYMIRYFSGIAREGAIIKILDTKMPANLEELLARVLKQCQRRIPNNSFASMKTLIAWITFSYRGLTVYEANRVLDILLPDKDDFREDFSVEEEIQDTFFQVLQLTNLQGTNDIDDVSSTNVAGPLSTLATIQEHPVFDDGQLVIRFRERAMKYFMSSALDSGADLRTHTASAHAQIFMICSKVIHEHANSTETDRNEPLHDYAYKYCLRHWTCMKPVDNKEKQNIELMTAFAGLMTDGKFARGLESLSSEYVLSNLMLADEEVFREKWPLWSKYANQGLSAKQVNTDIHSLEYWNGDVADAFIPLARAHIGNWLHAVDRKSALRSYRFARSAVSLTSHASLLRPGYDIDEENPDVEKLYVVDDRDEDEILALSQLFDYEIDSNAQYAIGIMLDQRGLVQSANAALERAIEICENDEQQARNYEQLASILLLLEDSESALRYSALSVSLSINLSPKLRAMALRTQACAQYELELYGDCAKSYTDARTCDEVAIKDEDLFNEIDAYWMHNDVQSAMDMFLSFKPIERLNVLTYDSEWNEWMMPDAPRLLMLIATRTGKIDELIDIYTKAIKTLDAEKSGAPLRIALAYIYMATRSDTSTTKELLNQVLTSTYSDFYYKLTEAKPVDIAALAINMLTDILFREFLAANQPDIKIQLISEVKSLPLLPLPASLQISDTEMTPHMLVLAKMLRKSGPPMEYQKLMNLCYNICLANLNDSIDWNDSTSIWHLTTVLIQFPSLRTQAEILNCAQFYDLDEYEAEEDDEEEQEEAKGGEEEEEEGNEDEGEGEENNDDDDDDDDDEDDEDDDDEEGSDDAKYDNNEDSSWCMGICYPQNELEGWKKKPTIYQCLVCTQSWLCQQCYDIRMRYNKHGRKENEPDFCCSYNKYLYGRAVGWKGMRNGRMYLEHDPDDSSKGDKRIKFTDFKESIRLAWIDAWDEFWAGE